MYTFVHVGVSSVAYSMCVLQSSINFGDDLHLVVNTFVTLSTCTFHRESYEHDSL